MPDIIDEKVQELKERAEKHIDPDVIVVLRSEGAIVNSNMSTGLSPALGIGRLGYMQLGDK